MRAMMPVFYLLSLLLHHRDCLISPSATWLSSIMAGRYEQYDTKALMRKTPCENHERIARIQRTGGGRQGKSSETGAMIQGTWGGGAVMEEALDESNDGFVRASPTTLVL